MCNYLPFQVAVLRVPSQHQCRDVLVFQTQPYSLCRFVRVPTKTRFASLSADSCAIVVSIQTEIKLVSITALGASCEVALGLRLDSVAGVERLSVTFG